MSRYHTCEDHTGLGTQGRHRSGTSIDYRILSYADHLASQNLYWTEENNLLYVYYIRTDHPQCLELRSGHPFTGWQTRGNGRIFLLSVRSPTPACCRSPGRLWNDRRSDLPPRKQRRSQG